MRNPVELTRTELEQAFVRYEKLRRLNPREFHALWDFNLHSGIPFDTLVDQLSELPGKDFPFFQLPLEKLKTTRNIP